LLKKYAFLSRLLKLQKWRSLHSPLFSSQTLVGLRWTQSIQNAEFLALEWLELSSDFLVTFWCMLAGLVSPTDFPAGLSAKISQNQQSNSTRNDQTPPESPTKFQQTPLESLTEVQQTPMDSKQTAFLISIINKK